MNAGTTDKPEPERRPYLHSSGRQCERRPYWVGNIRDGHWEYAYWHKETTDPDDYWRYCGHEHAD